MSGGEERNWWFNGDEDWDFPVATKQDEVKPQANEFGGPGTVLEAGRMEKQAEEHAASAKI